MNLPDYLIVGMVLLAAAFALRHAWKHRKDSCGSCSGCSGCSESQACHAPRKSPPGKAGD